MKTRKSIALFVIFVLVLLQCGCQTGKLRNDEQLDKEQIIKLYSEEKDTLCEILEYAETTDGNLHAALSDKHSVFRNGGKNIQDKKVIKNIKLLRKEYGIYGVY